LQGDQARASKTRKKEAQSGYKLYKESLRNLVLRILADGPQHGYEIMKRIEQVTEGRWKPAAGTLYPLLEQLRAEGLIEVERVDNSRVRGGKKIVYKLTEYGWGKLADILRVKSKTKFDIIAFYLVEGAAALRRAGYEAEADEICRNLVEGLGKLGRLVDETCRAG